MLESNMPFRPAWATRGSLIRLSNGGAHQNGAGGAELLGPNHISVSQQVAAENVVAEACGFGFDPLQLIRAQPAQVKLTVKVALPKRDLHSRQAAQRWRN
ncbi:hypothetical protein HF908_18745 (plasmid) [Ralstonia pseudosolanacearum]|uniref:hypothetical protein n=1 Tax=Ralstonia pseudosolanacearum TaxID=1310165 RepID=UPI0018669ECD|nr:hypothetical protein [Ralstonia pseudosolanacearum]QOK93574.1 hypothetical protein HF908_18745 [Ralstonia pseudosolanacearum]